MGCCGLFRLMRNLWTSRKTKNTTSPGAQGSTAGSSSIGYAYERQRQQLQQKQGGYQNSHHYRHGQDQEQEDSDTAESDHQDEVHDESGVDSGRLSDSGQHQYGNNDDSMDHSRSHYNAGNVHGFGYHTNGAGDGF